MRPIPAAMRLKLLARFKAASTGAEPKIKIIATQTAVNTLMSEPIHENVAADFGDVTFRQTAGEKEISVAYAICIHEGVASVYQRALPASMDAVWEFVFTLGEADDVAIEFDGQWELDPSNQWYILRTEQFPYIFFVRDGFLYVQHWRDEESRMMFPFSASQISACRGWQNSIDRTQDQGLICGFIHTTELIDREVMYVSLCEEGSGKVWRSWSVDELGEENETLAVFRTNDYRVGFLTENNGEIKLALSSRNYVGGSVRAETMHAASRASFEFWPLGEQKGFERAYVKGQTTAPFFLLDSVPASPEIALVSAEKINRSDSYYCYGVKLTFDHDLFGEIDAAFIAEAKVSYTEGTTTKSAAVTSGAISGRTISLYFSVDIRRVNPITVTTPVTRLLKYKRVQNMYWFFPSFTASLAEEAVEKDGYSPETLTTDVDAGFELAKAIFKSCYELETLSTQVTATFVLTPSSVLPI